MEIRDLLAVARGRHASDLHIKVGNHPILRVNGRLLPLTDLPVLDAAFARALIEAMMTDEQKAHFHRHLELDFACSLAGVSRFRVNVYHQRGSIGAAIRAIPRACPPWRTWGCQRWSGGWPACPRGLVLVTGPTGSGKSTALAAMIYHINQTRAVHIVTIEDPIEYLHRDIRSVIREGKTHQIPSAIMSGARDGMQTLTQALRALVEQKKVADEDAVSASPHEKDLAQLLGRIQDLLDLRDLPGPPDLLSSGRIGQIEEIEEIGKMESPSLFPHCV